jgi:hypothetical protein
MIALLLSLIASAPLPFQKDRGPIEGVYEARRSDRRVVSEDGCSTSLAVDQFRIVLEPGGTGSVHYRTPEPLSCEIEWKLTGDALKVVEWRPTTTTESGYVGNVWVATLLPGRLVGWTEFYEPKPFWMRRVR